MSIPYFQRPWPAFTHQGTTYDLTHLDEYSFSVIDSAGIERRILVSFSDHCFTRRPESDDDPALAYVLSDRHPGHFCVERYALSREIRSHIATAVNRGKVYLSEAENLAVIAIATAEGRPCYYGIFFNLDRAPKRFPFHLHMRVRTAFPFLEQQPVTHGDTRFTVLVAKRIKGEYPKRFIGGSKRWPPL